MFRGGEMASKFRGDGYSAQIDKIGAKYMLTLRDSRGRLFGRRRYGTYDMARDEMWRYSNRWRVA